jgi:RNA polymerase sigma factor (sigma-70 family)
MEFQELYNKYHRPLIKFALMGVRDLEDAKDLVSDAFLSFLENWDKLQKQETWKVSAYVFTTIRYKLSKYYRDNFYRRPLLSIESIQEHEFMSAPAVFSKLDCEDIERIAFIVLDGFPKKHNKAFILYRIEGMDATEVCKKLKLTKTQLYYIDQRIRRAISSKLTLYHRTAIHFLDEDRKVKLLELAEKLGNMAMACRIMGHSKATGLKLNKLRKNYRG